MSDDILLHDQSDGVLTLTMNRPEVLNALTDPLLDALTDALTVAEDDDDVRAVVITGAGRAFCAGQDLTAFSAGEELDVRQHLAEHYIPTILTIREIEKPVIACVNGVAAGAGLSLALACDLRVAAESAVLIQAFVRIGLVPDAGGTWFLPRLVGPARAMELALLGEPLDAAKALEWGLVNRVAADGAVAAETHALAARLAEGPRSVGMIKRLLADSDDRTLGQQMAAEGDAQARAVLTGDFLEGVAAFFEKRPARFQGK